MKTSRKKTPLRFVVPPPVPLGQKCHVVQHKKFSQKFTSTKKKKDAETGSYGEKEIT